MEAYHPFVVEIAGAIIETAPGALSVSDAAMASWQGRLQVLPDDEGREVAVHLVGFAQVLHTRHGAAVQPLVEQLALLAAYALRDLQGARDAFAKQGIGVLDSAVSQAIGAQTFSRPVEHVAGAASVLDVKLKRLR